MVMRLNRMTVPKSIVRVSNAYGWVLGDEMSGIYDRFNASWCWVAGNVVCIVM
jgi:hypothetical protein